MRWASLTGEYAGAILEIERERERESEREGERERGRARERERRLKRELYKGRGGVGWERRGELDRGCSMDQAQ
jgi:hypothetical protein